MIYAYDIFRINTKDLSELSTACTKDSDLKNCIKDLTDVVISFGT